MVKFERPVGRSAIVLVLIAICGLYTGSRFSFEDNNVINKQKAEGLIKDLSREDLYAERRDTVRKGCMKINATIRNELTSRKLRVERKHSIVYCPIPKIGSTFWTRVLGYMGRGKTNQSMLNVMTNEALGLTPISRLTAKQKQNLKANGTSMLFIRDPYTRLFSGYENKIYHSNPTYWNMIGQSVVKYARASTSPVYKTYGFNVTFPEFVSYIIYSFENNLFIEQHFAPMHKRCDPCATRFEYIGKIETFKEDAEYLINKWRKEYDDFNIHVDDFVQDSAIITARGRANTLYSTKPILEQIKFPFRKLMLRTWRDLQIRGYLSKHFPFPYDEDDDVDNVTREEFLEELKQGLAATTDREAAKAQRQEALIQAYRSVPMEDMERLRLYVMKDCLLFGFDDRPDYLFNRSLPVDDSFLYLDGL